LVKETKVLKRKISKTKEILGDSKPIVARSVATNIEYIADEIGWKNFIQLKSKLESLIA